MTHDPNIWRAARLLIDRHGEGAALRAAQRRRAGRGRRHGRSGGFGAGSPRYRGAAAGQAGRRVPELAAHSPVYGHWREFRPTATGGKSTRLGGHHLGDVGAGRIALRPIPEVLPLRHCPRLKLGAIPSLSGAVPRQRAAARETRRFRLIECLGRTGRFRHCRRPRRGPMA